MLKKLAAIGLGAALILAPVATMAQTPAPDATPAAAATPKPMVHKAKAKHVVKKPVAKKHVAKKPAAKKPMPAPTETPKS
ncbi:MAG: hypothetical protein ABSC22_16390 [Roseiarcus sp.]|jgi:hypothetical protein